MQIVDLFPVFRADYLARKENLYLYDHLHWNAEGNRIAAQEALKVINKSRRAE